MSTAPLPVFDGHNDVLLRLWLKRKAEGVAQDFVGGDGLGHLDLPRMKEGGLLGGFFAAFVPSGEIGPGDAFMRGAADAPPSLEMAQRATDEMLAILNDIVALSNGEVMLCRTAAECKAAMARGALAAVFHIEGAEAIDTDFKKLEELYAKGLRSVGPVWSRSNLYAHGVPFRFPASPDIGPGLTDLGRELVKLCDQMGIMLDMSHMNEAGFWDVARLSTGPLVATHSNAHALTAHSRNLTDKQLDAIKERRGMVGLNFGAMVLRKDGERNPDTPISLMADHIDYLVERLGIDCVGLGSDFDGTTIPRDIADARDLPKITRLLVERGYDEDALTKLHSGNWMRIFGEAVRG
jgi:membrane dipeptidase